MKLSVRYIILLSVVLWCAGSNAFAQIPAPTPPVQEKSSAATHKPTETEMRALLATQDAARLASRPKTKERAEAAVAAMKTTAALAWLLFEAGKFDEAATWFARRSELQKEIYLNQRAVAEAEADARLATLQAAIKDFREKLATAADEEKKKDWRSKIQSGIRILNSERHASLSVLQIIAGHNDDWPTLLTFDQQQLELNRLELDELVRTGARPEEINAKKIDTSKTLSSLGATRRQLGELSEAERRYLEALNLRRELPADSARRLYEPLSDLGLFYYAYIGDFKKAREYYEQALKDFDQTASGLSKEPKPAAQPPFKALMKSIDDSVLAVGHATMFKNLGAITAAMGDYEGGLAYLDRALEIAEALPRGDHVNLDDIVRETVQTTELLRTNPIDEVARKAARTFELARVTIHASVLKERASIHADTGELKQALEETNEAITIIRGLGNDDALAGALQAAGSLYYQSEDLLTARRYYEQARQIFVSLQNVRGVITATLSMAVLAQQAGQLNKASDDASEAIVMARNFGSSHYLAGAARVLAQIRLDQHKLSEAAALLDEAAAVDRRAGAALNEPYTLRLQGQVLEAQGNLEGALEKYTQSIKLLESVRATAANENKFADVKNHYRVYELIVRLLIRMNRGEEAFDYLSRAKSRKLQDTMRLASLKVSEPVLQALLERASLLETQRATVATKLESEKAKAQSERDPRQIQNMKALLAKTDGEFLKVSYSIRARNEALYNQIMTQPPINLKNVQEDIPSDTIIVEYAPFADQLYVFLAGKDKLRIYAPPVKSADLWKRINAVRKQIITSAPLNRGVPQVGSARAERDVGLEENLSALYQMLIVPIEGELADKSVIAFIPTQLLYYLPLQALIRKQGTEKHYLIEDKQIVYLAAADGLKHVTPQKSSRLGQGMIAFGNPTGAGLPGALAEVTDIANVFPAAEFLAGAQVTKAAVTDTDHLNRRIIHFATHAFVGADHRQTYIQLAAGASLTLIEVLDLNLKRVDLVTLSACQTAVGNHNPEGTEITSLAQAFSNAGARSVIASLWRVSDDSTKEIMVEFYKQLAAGHSKAAAMQSAQLKVMKNPAYNHPYFWAPFILMGDWR